MLDVKILTILIRQIAEEKNLPIDKVLEATETAIAAAYKKEYGKKSQIIKAKLDLESENLVFSQVKIVVAEENILKEDEDDQLEKLPGEKKESSGEKEMNGEKKEEKIRFNPERHILLTEARKIKEDIQPGEEIIFPLETKHDFSRIAAQTAKQVILQRLHELEKEITIAEFKDKEGNIVSGVIQRIEKNNIYVDLGKAVGVLYSNEGIPGEYYRIGDRKRFYVLSLEDRAKGPVVLLSRSHPKFVSRLFETEVPEIAEGIVEIVSIAREAGKRTKIAVASKEENIDPVGACVGQKGTRVATVIDELNGEKIDIIPYYEEPAKYVIASLGPANVKETEIISERREIRIFVPPDQISLAIGKEGQNVRLAAKLTGWRIDIRSVMSPDEVLEGGVADSLSEEKETENLKQ